MDELATVEGTFVVEHPLGLHAVLAVKLATVAQGFRSDIGFRVGGRLADVKDAADVIRLSAAVGTEVDVVIQGSDAQRALDVISDFLVDEGLIS